jgi:hypothetical protein
VFVVCLFVCFVVYVLVRVFVFVCVVCLFVCVVSVDVWVIVNNTFVVSTSGVHSPKLGN